MSAWNLLYEQFQRVERPDGATTPEEFAEMIGRSRCAARVILNKMVKKGMATRHRYNLATGGVGFYYVVANRG